MPLKLHNTLTRTLEEFQPLDETNVRMYVCGITPYDHAHIGHARVYVVYDVLFRLLKNLYGDSAVTYARNFTDIDDKIIARANERGEDPVKLAQTFIESYHADMAALNILPPTHEPRVSDPKVMSGIVAFIEKLAAKNAAYKISDGVYLDISRIDALREPAEHYHYGQLSGKKLDDLIAGARVDVNPEKRNAGDFALWKLAKPGEPSWPSPWGAGRPGWHIECSVMSEQLLGDRFDLHGGGEDLQFPHHENELAQSVACHGHIHANTWLHNAFITVGGKKMSKSLGNFTTIKDALARYSPMAVRLWLLQTHYRKPVDFTGEALQAAENRWAKLARKAAAGGTAAAPQAFLDALLSDLNTSKALSHLEANPESLPAMFALLGLKA